MRLRSFAAAFLLLTGTLAAHADTIFNLNATSAAGAVVSGTVTIDTVAGTIKSETITYTLGAAKDSFTGPTYQSTYAVSPTQTVYYSNSSDALNNIFQLTLPTASLVGYTGGAICSTSASCSGYVSAFSTGSSSDAMRVGQLSTAVTPEPSGLTLLGTGALGMAGLLRRRFLRSC